MFTATVKLSTRTLSSGITIYTIRYDDGRTIDFADVKTLVFYLDQNNLEIELRNGRAA
jgi:hypothetical protein